jgi:eukaryotic-like serine/threonine-protein kinase
VSARKCPTCSTRYDGEVAFCAADGTPLVELGPDDDALVGTVFADRYRILRVLGQGGMGRVYEAEHVNINKKLAIKVLRPEVVADPATVARFRQEARSASSIGHENIIEIEDFATLPDKSVYLAMELLQGQPLGVRMREPPPLSVLEAVKLMLPVCDALNAAHQKGIVHRDMKPDNIFLAHKGGRLTPKILDFGIAKVSGEEGGVNLTQAGAIFGTPLYMSPEQAKGAPLDHRTDIYSVGVILYELLTGRVPFKADSQVQLLSAHITIPPPSFAEVAPDRAIPPALEQVVLRAMSKSPADRQASMAELHEQLRVGAAQPTAAQPVIAVPASSAPRTTERPAAAAIPERKRNMVLPMILGAAVAGAVLFFALRKPSQSVTVAPPPVAPVPIAPPPVTADDDEVIVTSAPPGAKILRDGALIATTPEAVKVGKGKTLSVVVRKDGYIEQAVIIDPSKDRKMTITLEKIARKTSTPKPAPTPPPTPVAAAPTAPPPPAPKPPPPAPRPPPDPLMQAIERQAAMVAPGSKRVGHVFAGEAPRQDGRTDWYFPLDMGKCYTFVATAAPGVQELLIYLWGPAGNRVVPRAEGRPTAVMQYCAQMSGMYHFQSKAGRGFGAYKMAIYQR